MSNDGLSNDEIINILFKSYMNFTTTSDDKLFYEETLLKYNNNILSSNILSDTPPDNPTFTEITSYETVNMLLGSNFVIDSTWFDDKTEYGSFGSETTNIVMRLEKIKLDYLGSNSSAFVCFDNSNNNILKNLIPSNYSSQGYSLSLHYELNSVLKSVPWLATRTELAGSVAIGTSVDFGGALFDTKNGIVTFYDVNGEPSDVFTDKIFYLTATKYIGTLGISNNISSNTITANSFIGNELYINDTAILNGIDVSNYLKVPFGSSDISSNKFKGYIRYNDVSNEYQGYDVCNNVWSNLGQTKEVWAQDTNGDISYGGNVFIDGYLNVYGASTFYHTLDVSNAMTINDTLTVMKNTTLHSSLHVNEDASFNARLQVVGDVSMEENLTVNKDIYAKQDIYVTGDISASNIIGEVSTTNLLSHQNTVLTNNVNIGNIDSDIYSTVFNVYASSNGEHGIIYDGNVTIYGGTLRIKEGASLVVDGSYNTIDTEIITSDSIYINNEGTTTALIVNQTDTNNENIAIFQELSSNVFVIGKNGNTSITGVLNVNSATSLYDTLDVSNEVTFRSSLNVNQDILLGGNLTISEGNIFAGGELYVSGATTLYDTLHVSNKSTFHSSLFVNNDISLGGNLIISEGNVFAGGELYVSGETTLNDTLDVSKAATFHSSLFVNNDISLGGNLKIREGNVFAGGYLEVSGATILYNTLETINATTFHSSLFVSDDISLGGNLKISKGNVFTGGDLDVSGVTTLYNTLDVSNTATFHSSLFVSHDISLGRNLSISEGNLFVGGILDISGATTLYNTLDVSNTAMFHSSLFVNNDISLGGNLIISEGNIFIGGLLDVSKPTTLYDTLDVSNDATFHSSFFVSQDVSLGGNLVIREGKAFIGGGLDVSDYLKLPFGSSDISNNEFKGYIRYNNVSHEYQGYDVCNNMWSNLGGVEVWKQSTNGDISYGGTVFIDGSLDVSSTVSLHNTLDVYNEAIFHSSLFVSDDVSLGGNLIIREGNAFVGGGLDVSDYLKVPFGSSDISSNEFKGYIRYNDVSNEYQGYDACNNVWSTLGGNTITGEIEELWTQQSNGDISYDGTVFIGGKLDVSGPSTFYNTLDVSNTVTFHSSLFVSDDVSLGGNLIIRQGNAFIGGGLDVSDYLKVPFGSSDISSNEFKGYIRYNDVSHEYQGYDVCNNVWSSLGGTVITGEIDEIWTQHSNGDISYSGTVFIDGSLNVNNTVYLHNTLDVSNSATFHSSLYVNNDISLSGNLTISEGNIFTGGYLEVSGETILYDALGVYNDVTFHSSLFVNNDVSLGGNLVIREGNAFVGGGLDVSDYLKVPIGSSDISSNEFKGYIRYNDVAREYQGYNIYNNVWSSLGGTTISGEKEEVWTQDSNGNISYSGNVFIDGSLNVNNTVSLDNTLDVSNAATFHSSLFVSDDISLGGNLVIREGNAFVGGGLDVSDYLKVPFGSSDISSNDFKGYIRYNDVSHEYQGYDVCNNVWSSLGGTEGVWRQFTNGDISYDGTVFIDESLNVKNNVTIRNTLDVSNAATFHSSLFVSDDISLGGNLVIHEGNAFVGGGLDVSDYLKVPFGSSDISSNDFKGYIRYNDVSHEYQGYDVCNNVWSSLGGTEGVWRQFTNGDISYDGTVFIDESLNVKNNITIHNTLDVSNTATLHSSLFVNNDISLGGNLKIREGNVFAGGELYVSEATTLYKTLDVSNTATLHSSLIVNNDISLGGNLKISEGNVFAGGELYVSEATTLYKTLDVSNTATLHSSLIVNNDISLGGNLKISKGNILAGRDLYVSGATTLYDTLDVSNTATLHSSLIVNNDISLGGNLKISEGNVFAGGELYVSEATTLYKTLDVSNTATLHSSLIVNNDISLGGNLKISKGNVFAGGELYVSGATTLYDTLDVSNVATFHSSLFVNNDISLGGNLKISQGNIFTGGEFDVSGVTNLHNTLDVIKNTTLHSSLHVIEDASFNADLQVVGDVSMEKNLTVINDINAKQNIYVTGDVSATNIIGNVLATDLISQQNTALSNNVNIGNFNSIYSEDISNTVFNVYASSNGEHGIIYDGDVTIYGGTLRIKEGATFVIDGSYNTINTEIIDSSSLFITNQGTTTTLIVNQIDTNNENIAEFQDASSNVFVIGKNGDTSIKGDLSLNGNLIIGGEIETDLLVTESLNTNTLTSDTVIANTIQFNETTITTTDTSNNIGAMRFNTTRNLFEYFSTESVWNSITTYKGDQPPYLLNPQFTSFSQSILIEWTKFNSVYVDSFDGKAYPLSLQTFIDIRFTDINNTSTSGWNTLYIGKGSYDINGNATTHLESFTITSSSDTAYTNNTDYTISFSDKPSTITLPSFTQNDRFDLRIYAVNQSKTTPNYIYLYNVMLKQTGPPGSITVISSDRFLQNQFTIELTYDLDSLDSTVTSGLDIAQYDISFTRIDSKSLSPVTHSGNLLIDWDGSTSLSKSDINVTDLHPGAQYEINVRAQNTASLDSSTTTGYAYGHYGNVFSSTDFTNIGTYQYITSSDLNSVSSTGMAFSLVGNSTINCNVSGTSSRTNRIIMNTNSSISVTGISEFYVNYGLQGTDMTDSTNLTLVNTVITKYVDGTSNSSITIPYISVSDPTSVTAQSDSVAGYTFSSASSYTDEGDSNNYNKGFVYSSTIERIDPNTNNTIFNSNFVASTNSYELKYVITSTTNNQSARINNSGNTSVSNTTSEFYVDDYSSTPTITMSTSPTISVISSTTLFGIPSVLTVQLTALLQISNFASYIIPHNSSNYHTVINAISDKNSYSFALLGQTNISSTDAYTIAYSKTSSVGSSSYDANTESSFITNVSYLNHSSSPTINTQTNATTIGDIGVIFRDSSTTYSGLTLYTFNGSDTIGSSLSSSSSIDNNTLLYFNGRFVSGGYSTTYDGTSIHPFSNWSSGYAISGQDYSTYASTGTAGFKWIVFDVSTKQQSGGILDLTTFKINGSTPTLSNFGSTYKAYIYQHGNIGALNSVNNTGATSWFNQGNTTISSAQSGNGASSDGINGFVNLSLSGDIYLIVGLPISSNEYIMFS